MADIQPRFKDALPYDAMIEKVLPGYGQLSGIALGHLRTRLAGQAHVLDVGCGTGSTLTRLADDEPAWTLEGVDPAEAMVGPAREKAEALDAEGRLELPCGTADTLPEQPLSDPAVGLPVDHLLPDDGTRLRFLKGISGRLVSGGSSVLLGLHGDLGTPKAPHRPRRPDAVRRPAGTSRDGADRDSTRGDEGGFAGLFSADQGAPGTGGFPRRGADLSRVPARRMDLASGVTPPSQPARGSIGAGEDPQTVEHAHGRGRGGCASDGS